MTVATYKIWMWNQSVNSVEEQELKTPETLHKSRSGAFIVNVKHILP